MDHVTFFVTCNCLTKCHICHHSRVNKIFVFQKSGFKPESKVRIRAKRTGQFFWLKKWANPDPEYTVL